MAVQVRVNAKFLAQFPSKPLFLSEVHAKFHSTSNSVFCWTGFYRLLLVRMFNKSVGEVCALSVILHCSFFSLLFFLFYRFVFSSPCPSTWTSPSKTVTLAFLSLGILNFEQSKVSECFSSSLRLPLSLHICIRS